MTTHLLLTVRDPIIAGDGRPFGVGHRMRSLPWPYPSVAAGALRTLLGKLQGAGFSSQTLAALKNLSVAGPLPFHNGQLFFAAPYDALLQEDPRRCFALRPCAHSPGEGCDLPRGLWPALPPASVQEEFQPGALPPFWSMKSMAGWLTNARGDSFQVPPLWQQRHEFAPAPAQDVRQHMRISPGTGAAEAGLVYATVGLAFPEELRMALRIESEGSLASLVATLDALHPFGGERRLVHWKAFTTMPAWICPAAVSSALAGARRIRLTLATPALFQDGWKPGWLAHDLTGTVPGAPLRVKLVAACVPRWRPISGWCLESGAPKPVRRLAPAGSVYFLEVLAGNPADLCHLWLRSVCDAPQDARDGFGLALWGIWDHFKIDGA